MPRRKRFGEILVDAKVLDEITLSKALEKQKISDMRLGEVLEEMGIISDRDVVLILARQFNCKTVSNISKHPFPEDVLGLIDCDTALEKGIFPLKAEGKALYLAITNPLDLETLDNVSFQTGMRVVPLLTTPHEVQDAIRKHYIKVVEGKLAEELTVMVVDDQELWRAAFQGNLKKEGLRSVQFDSGSAALKAVLKERPHLILVDPGMTGMSGIEFFRVLQSNSGTRDIPVIALSIKASPDEEARLLEMGFFDFVAKPANLVRLMARVKRALKITCGADRLPVP
ncbi:MAG: response regulator [Desulfuromonadaceae bacterium]|nr:response regulator [Desulfuromonadaceae bacterium]